MNIHRKAVSFCSCLLPLVCLVVAVGSIRNIFNADYWWHLSCGRWMVEHHRIMFADPFTFTVPAHPFFNFEWLFQVALYYFYSLGQVPAVLLFKASLVGLSAWGVYRTLNDSLPCWLKAALVLLVFDLSRFHNMVRADLATLCLFPWFLAFFEHSLEWTKGSDRSQQLRIQFAIFAAGIILWANTHGGFWLIAPLFVFGGLAWAQRNPKLSRFSKNPFVWMASVFVLTINATPYGWKIPYITYHHIVQLLSGSGDFFIETLHPTLKGSFWFWIVVGCAWMTKITQYSRERIIDAWTWGTLAYGTWLGQLYVRNIPLSLMLVVPVFSQTLYALLTRRLSSDDSRHRFFCKIAFSIGLILFLISCRRSQWGIDQTYFPKGAADFIEKNIPALWGYNDFNFGGYLMWRFYEEKRPIFLDSRCASIEGYWDIFLASVKAQEFSAESLSQWQLLLNRWPIDWTLMSIRPERFYYKGQPLSRLAYYLPKEDWALVYYDRRTALYVRRIKALSLIIKKYEQPGVYPDCDSSSPFMKLPWKDLFDESEMNSKTSP